MLKIAKLAAAVVTVARSKDICPPNQTESNLCYTTTGQPYFTQTPVNGQLEVIVYNSDSPIEVGVCNLTPNKTTEGCNTSFNNSVVSVHCGMSTKKISLLLQPNNASEETSVTSIQDLNSNSTLTNIIRCPLLTPDETLASAMGYLLIVLPLFFAVLSLLACGIRERITAHLALAIASALGITALCLPKHPQAEQDVLGAGAGIFVTGLYEAIYSLFPHARRPATLLPLIVSGAASVSGLIICLTGHTQEDKGSVLLKKHSGETLLAAGLSAFLFSGIFTRFNIKKERANDDASEHLISKPSNA